MADTGQPLLEQHRDSLIDRLAGDMLRQPTASMGALSEDRHSD
jgi:hypothetical protein